MAQEVEVSSLKQILEDETRQKIIRILKEKGRLSYADLMDELDFALKHLFDHHLKELNGLIEKTEKGTYTLSAKGQQAYKNLHKYPVQSSFKKKAIKASTEFNKLLFIAAGGFGLGGLAWVIIWTFITQTGYMALLLKIDPSALIYATSLFFCWGLGGVVGYLIGKKRNYVFPTIGFLK